MVSETDPRGILDPEEWTRDRQIDPGQLDIEAIRQAEVFFKWAERSVDAKAEADRNKLALDIQEASLAIKCRDHPEKFGLVKATEGAINAAVKTHPYYEEAYTKWLDSRANWQLLEKMVEAMEQRKRMLEILITLHGQEYFAGPSVPHDLVATWKEAQEKTGDAANTRMKGSVRRRKKGGDA